MVIRILAGTKRDRVRLAEKLITLLLDDLGYSGLHFTPKESGLDLTVTARHESPPHPLFCRVKALSSEVRRDDLVAVHRQYLREKKRAKHLVGVYFSLSGFQEAAHTWYQKLPAAHRSNFHLFDTSKIITLLRRMNCIAAPEVIEQACAARTTLSGGDPVLVYGDGDFCWVLLLSTGKTPTHYTVLGAHGTPVSARCAHEIKRLDGSLKGKRSLDCALRDALLIAVAENPDRNLEELVTATRKPVAAVRTALQELLKEKILEARPAGVPRWIHDRHSLRPDFDLFLRLAPAYLSGPHRFRFLGSPSVAPLLAVHLLPFVEDRFKVTFPEEERGSVRTLLTVSPSALRYTLFSSPEGYVDASCDIEARVLPPADREKLRAAHLQRLLSDILRAFVADLGDPRLAEIMASKGIRAFLYRLVAKAASLHGAAFSLRAESHTPLPKTSGGRVSPEGLDTGDPDRPLEVAAALMHMREYDHAIEFFEQAVRDLRDPDKLAVAWNSKGLCHLNQRRFSAATTCFNEALKYNTNSREAWFYKALCLKELGDTTGAVRCGKRALEIDPHYTEARDLLRTL